MFVDSFYGFPNLVNFPCYQMLAEIDGLNDSTQVFFLWGTKIPCYNLYHTILSYSASDI